VYKRQHIGKLFILLPKGKAEEILRKIIFNIGEFKFLPLIYEK